MGTALGVLVFAGLSLYGDAHALYANLTAFAWTAFGLALMLASTNYALRFLRWHLYLGEIEVKVPWKTSLLVFLSGFVMSVTPGKLGEVWKSFLLWETHEISVAKTAPIVIAERVTDLLALVLLTAFGSLFFDEGAWIAAIGAFATFGLIAVVSIRPLGEFALRVAAMIPGIRRIVPRLREAWESLAVLVRPVPLLWATGLATFSWGFECVALWLIVNGFDGSSIELGPASLTYAASTIAGALAMLPGGLGVTEAGMAGSLQLLGEGITPAIATGATLLVRLATLWWAVLVGALALFVLRRTQLAKI
jgi:uncharacterized protein (TIRG00374 family)